MQGETMKFIVPD